MGGLLDKCTLSGQYKIVFNGRTGPKLKRYSVNYVKQNEYQYFI
jgi:hypothetical protein